MIFHFAHQRRVTFTPPSLNSSSTHLSSGKWCGQYVTENASHHHHHHRHHIRHLCLSGKFAKCTLDSHFLRLRPRWVVYASLSNEKSKTKTIKHFHTYSVNKWSIKSSWLMKRANSFDRFKWTQLNRKVDVKRPLACSSASAILNRTQSNNDRSHRILRIILVVCLQ